MSISEVATCRSCDTRIVWCRTANDKVMPVDMEPAAGGNVRVSRDAAGGTVATVLGPLEVDADTSGRLRKSHFATCPDADRWRNRDV